MAKGFKHGAGGASALNFKIVGGAIQPGNPKENTIWVNTQTEISGWAFSATEPGSPVEGMVWILTGTSSKVEFNVLKKNCVQVYPISAKQYVSGAWVDVTAKSYQGSEWVDWIMWDNFLFYHGIFVNGQSYVEVDKKEGSFTVYDDRININAGSTSAGYMYGYFSKPFSTKNKSIITVRLKSNGDWTTTGTEAWQNGLIMFASTSTNPQFSDPLVRTKKLTAGVEYEISIDVSAVSDERYLHIRPTRSGGNGTLDVDIFEVEVS